MGGVQRLFWGNVPGVLWLMGRVTASKSLAEGPFTRVALAT